jgi:hypothetical protein
VTDRWWLVAGRLKVGSGRREPGVWEGESLTPRTEADLLTSLFRGCEVDSIFGSMGVVDPVCEKAYEPLECEITADTGRELGVRLESRDFDMLFEKRRSHFCDWAFGGTTTSSAMTTLPLALLRLLFTMFAAFSDWERPKRSVGRAENRSEWLNAKEKWSVKGEVYVAVAVALIA